MKAVRALMVVLAVLVVGVACDRSPTAVPEPLAPSALLGSSRGSPIAPSGLLSCRALPRCRNPKLRFQAPTYDRRSNYAVAW